jgi:hypothetical protein
MTELLFWTSVTALTLLLEHIALFRKPWRLSRPQAYALGTGTITLGYTGWAWSIDMIGAAIGLWVIVAVSGSVVWFAYLIRNALTTMTETARLSGRAGRPRSPALDQSTIDHGQHRV